jgi:hypothetical protein
MTSRCSTKVALSIAVVLVPAITACSKSDPRSDAEPTDTTTGPIEATVASSPGDELDVRFGLPPGARTSTGGGDPRPASYWAVWNTCAPENRADVAAANGYVLLDDILADPGIALGEHPVERCDEGVELLTGSSSDGATTVGAAYVLAGQLLAAELNLNVGAESCPVAEEAVVGAHLILSTAQFDGVSASPLQGEASGSLDDIVDLLTAYNTGELCR